MNSWNYKIKYLNWVIISKVVEGYFLTSEISSLQILVLLDTDTVLIWDFFISFLKNKIL